VTSVGVLAHSAKTLLSRSAMGDVEGSPFVETTSGEVFEVQLDKAIPYELDGGVRKKSKRLTFTVKPEAITVCVPQEEGP
jgi:diacylglycerol kinase (ATP)